MSSRTKRATNRNQKQTQHDIQEKKELEEKGKNVYKKVTTLTK